MRETGEAERLARDGLDYRTNQQEALVLLGRVALSAESIEKLQQIAIELLTFHLGVPIVELHRFHRAGRRFHLSASHGWASAVVLRSDIALHSAFGTALRTGQPIVSDDVCADSRFADQPAFEALGVRAALCLLVGTPETPLGAVSAYSLQPHSFTTEDVHFLEAVGTTLGESLRFHEANRRIIEVLDSVTDGFCALDDDLRMTYVNQQMADMFGTTRESMMGRSVEEFANNPENLKHFVEALERSTVITYETYNPARERWFEARVYPAPQGVSVYSRDITERKIAETNMMRLTADLEQRVAERTAQLEVANRDLESFSYSVSHDLRAPLRAIDGFGAALEEDFADLLGPQGRGYLNRIRNATTRMADLIDSLLQLSNLARYPIEQKAVDLAPIAESIASDLRERDRNRVVTFEIAPVLQATGEPMLLRAVLENLMGNAWKFTRNANGARIEVGRVGATDEFYVRDNGAGFDMTYADKLFGAFQRLHASTEYEGTGIGLATVARILHRHGGDIRAEGSVGGGATFYFRLPSR